MHYTIIHTSTKMHLES